MNELEEFAARFADMQIPHDPELAQLMADNFWDLV